jgi:hypothetical protein
VPAGCELSETQPAWKSEKPPSVTFGVSAEAADAIKVAATSPVVPKRIFFIAFFLIVNETDVTAQNVAL